MRTRQRRPARERGVAVITALLLTTLAISIVASLFWQQQVQVRSMENQRLHLQTKWILRGALDWSTLVLFQDGIDHRDYTSLDQVWATPLAETRLDQYVERQRVEGETFDASLSGNITDACSRYNLRNLGMSRGLPDPQQLEIFKRLLNNLQLDQGLALRIANFVAAGLPATVEEGNDPTRQQVAPVVGAPLKVLQVEDLLSVRGVTPAIVERLRPFVTVLPEKTPVNVNTAPAEVLAAVVPDMSVSEANTLIVRRKQAAWRGLNYFETEIGDNRKPAQDSASVKSDWFLVDSRIRLDRAALDAQALIHRSSNLVAGSGPKVVWIRQY
ncbi:type II secretion system minor pseudopilin GspK [Massilia sp. CT11-108]|uniref:type II secretion system minor pseudopilin GspK n=1 Tax=Massilia sp. CT11-108 TaxID=3393900 RepID=UPI0039A435CC